MLSEAIVKDGPKLNNNYVMLEYSVKRIDVFH